MTAPHFLTASDQRLKTFVENLQITQAMYDGLRPVSFTWNSNGAPDVGLFAQEVQAVAPHAVYPDTHSPQNYLYVDYAALVPYALAIAKNATDAVANLTVRVQTLEAHFPP